MAAMREGGRGPIRHPHKTAAMLLGTLAFTALSLGVSRPAQAQKLPIPIRLKLGILQAQDRDVRQAVGNPLFGGEVEVGLPIPSVGGRTSVSLGYMERRRDGRLFRVVPLTVSRIYSPPNPASGLTGNIYFGFGAGLYYQRASGGGDSDDETTIGGFGVVGYNFPKTLLIFDFVEAKYQLVAKGANNMSANGVIFMLGRKL